MALRSKPKALPHPISSWQCILPSAYTAAWQKAEVLQAPSTLDPKHKNLNQLNPDTSHHLSRSTPHAVLASANRPLLGLVFRLWGAQGRRVCGGVAWRIGNLEWHCKFRIPFMGVPQKNCPHLRHHDWQRFEFNVTRLTSRAARAPLPAVFCRL